jgi:hypothetical protein
MRGFDMSANTIHNSFKDIAKRHSIGEDKISPILESIKIKSSAKPSDEQLKGFEQVCQMVQSGIELDVAVQSIHEQAKNNNLAQPENGEMLPAQAQLEVEDGIKVQIDNYAFELAERAADASVAKIPQMAIEEEQRFREAFIQRFRQRLAERLQDPSVKQQFQAVIEGEDMGKLPMLSPSPTSNMALPSNSSSSS